VQALVSLQLLEDRFDYSYYMHADDDSYVRIDLVLELLVSVASCGQGHPSQGSCCWTIACRLQRAFKASPLTHSRQWTPPTPMNAWQCTSFCTRPRLTPPRDGALLQQAQAPQQRFYWGYIWDGTGNRKTAPIRNPRNKSHMPKEQVGRQLCSCLQLSVRMQAHRIASSFQPHGEVPELVLRGSVCSLMSL
jgi:hypothetical protein